MWVIARAERVCYTHRSPHTLDTMSASSQTQPAAASIATPPEQVKTYCGKHWTTTPWPHDAGIPFNPQWSASDLRALRIEFFPETATYIMVIPLNHGLESVFVPHGWDEVMLFMPVFHPRCDELFTSRLETITHAGYRVNKSGYAWLTKELLYGRCMTFSKVAAAAADGNAVVSDQPASLE